MLMYASIFVANKWIELNWIGPPWYWLYLFLIPLDFIISMISCNCSTPMICNIKPLNNIALQWRHNECNGVSNHRRLHCLLNCWLSCRSKKTPKLRVTDLCAGIHRWTVNSPHKWPVTRKMFPFDDVIITCYYIYSYPHTLVPPCRAINLTTKWRPDTMLANDVDLTSAAVLVPYHFGLIHPKMSSAAAQQSSDGRALPFTSRPSSGASLWPVGYLLLPPWYPAPLQPTAPQFLRQAAPGIL